MTEQNNVKNSLFDKADLKDLGGFNAGNLIAADPHLFGKTMRYLSKTIKRDPVSKEVIFLVGVSAYMSDPLNLFMRGPSSIGKTYVTTEVLKLFPQEDVWYIGAASPKFLIRQKGVLCDSNGDPIPHMEKPGRDASEDEKEAWQQYREKLKDSKMLIDLKGKMLVFLEAPNIELFNIIRPILSHDKREISFPYVEPQTVKTINVVMKNWPATIFCSTSEEHVQDLATRSLTISPEMSTQKYKAANILTGEKAALPWKYQRDDDAAELQGYLEALKNRLLDDKEPWLTLIPFAAEFGKIFDCKTQRSMRDFRHILSLIEALTAFYYAQRPILKFLDCHKEDTYLLATAYDFNLVIGLWLKVAETTETGAPAQILRFFREVCLQISGDFNTNTAADEWNTRFPDSRKSSDSIRKWIEFLCDISYLSKEPDPNDKRQFKVKVIKTERNGNYTKFQFSTIFTVDSLKAWLNNVKQITASKGVWTQQNLITGKELTDVDSLYVELANDAVIFSSASQGSLAEIRQEKTENSRIVQFPNFSPNDVKELVRLESNFGIETCAGCGAKGRPDWQITLLDNTYGLLCGSCGIKVSDILSESG